ncbi:hypothetical protein FIE12Z_5243 [Fusarium flagelliforme]|uniref:Uncharacterized protein n=1 Tax=Fusarium flagelliforme TaxID=2675880 RepID=A0A395MRS1_9HYPO|nr:hypothetical protein FIE12Z_5243 [Fusarium flagelliforme]
MSSQLKRKDSEPPNHEPATREIAEETTAAPVYERIIESMELERKLLADLQSIMARQKQIESSMKKLIFSEQKLALVMQMEMLASTGQTDASSEESYTRIKGKFADAVEKHAAWKNELSTMMEQFVLEKRTLGEDLYEVALEQASIAKAMLNSGEVNVLKEEH